MYGPIGCREERASVFDVILTSECLEQRHRKRFVQGFPRAEVRLQLLILVTRTLAGWFLAIKLSCSPIFMLIALVLLRPLSCLLGPSSTVHGGRRWLRLSRFSRRRGPLLSFLLLCFKVFLLAHFYVDRPRRRRRLWRSFRL